VAIGSVPLWVALMAGSSAVGPSRGEWAALGHRARRRRHLAERWRSAREPGGVRIVLTVSCVSWALVWIDYSPPAAAAQRTDRERGPDAGGRPGDVVAGSAPRRADRDRRLRPGRRCSRLAYLIVAGSNRRIQAPTNSCSRASVRPGGELRLRGIRWWQSGGRGAGRRGLVAPHRAVGASGAHPRAGSPMLRFCRPRPL